MRVRHTCRTSSRRAGTAGPAGLFRPAVAGDGLDRQVDLPGRSHGGSYAEMRRRLIEETELALLIGLRFPHRVQGIPMMEAGRGCFHPAFAARFWQDALGLEQTDLAVLEAGRAPVN